MMNAVLYCKYLVMYFPFCQIELVMSYFVNMWVHACLSAYMYMYTCMFDAQQSYEIIILYKETAVDARSIASFSVHYKIVPEIKQLLYCSEF